MDQELRDKIEAQRADILYDVIMPHRRPSTIFLSPIHGLMAVAIK